MKVVSRREKKISNVGKKKYRYLKDLIVHVKGIFFLFFRIRSPISRHHSLHHLDSSSLAPSQSSFPALPHISI